ncbi:MAG TPA: HAD family hydrolase [Actinopolymorphaceae bacterium]
MHSPTLHLDRIDAVLVDADHVVVDTARLHGAAWQQVFDEFLSRHCADEDVTVPGFDPIEDYFRYADGRPATETVREFLTARGVKIPEESRDRHADTVHSLAARKSSYVLTELRRTGVRTFPSAVTLLRNLRERGIRTAAVSASRNCTHILSCAQLTKLFDLKLDSIDAAIAGLPALPDPAVMLEATHRLGVSPRRTAVLTSSPVMAQAAWNGCFEPIIAVDRFGLRSRLYTVGAHVVVNECDELTIAGHRGRAILARG